MITRARVGGRMIPTLMTKEMCVRFAFRRLVRARLNLSIELSSHGAGVVTRGRMDALAVNVGGRFVPIDGRCRLSVDLW